MEDENEVEASRLQEYMQYDEVSAGYRGICSMMR
jgi:hypothetical protein